MGELITVILTVVGVIVWGVRLEGRVNAQEKLRQQSKEDFEKLLEVQFKGVHERLERIERKQDNANGKH